MEAMNLNSASEPSSEWYLYVSPSCYGPFAREQIIYLILSHQVNRDAKLLRGDQRIWRPILDCVNELTAPNLQMPEESNTERRIAAPRVEFEGTVKVDREALSLVGYGQDISITGVFVKTKLTRLSLGDRVDLNVKVKDANKPINAQAEVVRHNANSQFPVGYGLKFVDIGNDAMNTITKLVGVRPISEFGDVLTKIDSTALNNILEQTEDES